jgi:hypothetical protein
MKKLLLVAALAVLLVCILAAPAFAAKPNLVFVTHLTSDGAKLAGNSTGLITLPTKGVAGVDAMHYLGVTQVNANPGVANGTYPFYLSADQAQKDALTLYFEAKGWPQTYLDQIALEINGSAPFFWLSVQDGVYGLVDGFTGGQLRIDDDYLVGTYKYIGQLTGTNGATLGLTIALKVVLVK